MHKCNYGINPMWMSVVVTLMCGVMVLADNRVTFEVPVNYSVGTHPIAIATADFNRDSKPDLAVANEDDNNVSILLGQGDGTFQLVATVAVGRKPHAIAVGDFNNDGNMDLLVANAGTSALIETTVSIALGNGDGTFQAARSLEVGNTPFSVAVADFNADGKLDFVVAKLNYPNLGQVSCFLGNGDGTFRAGGSFDVGRVPTALVVDDFNRDSKPDYAVVNSGTNTVFAAVGYGDGWFRATHTFDVNGLAPISVVRGDFDNDGKMDLAVTNFDSGNVSIWLGNGDGWFHWVQNISVGENPLSIAASDFDGDGILDLAIANFGPVNDADGSKASRGVTIIFGQGNGMFMPGQAMDLGRNPAAMAVDDFNGDGKMDMAVVDRGSNTVSILLNTTP